LDYQKKLQYFIKVDNEHKGNLKQQRLGFVFKQLKEFDITNVTKIEAIK
jgi:hypothetical protein